MTERVREILSAVSALAAEYYRLTGRPLGITGGISEHFAADLLGLELAPPGTKAYDAIRRMPDGSAKHVQIKSRAVTLDIGGRRMGFVRSGVCDAVLLVLLDPETYQPREIWEAAASSVLSTQKEEQGLHIRTFLKLAECVWRRPVAA